ncbi:MAG: helix-turn-helix transcriptional regulator [Bacteroidales bacterium]|nr:helix-turn-helix transcriptional regulator [Bacteroidales bacterium]
MNKEVKNSIVDDFMNEITSEEAKKTEKRMLLAAKIDDSIKAKGWKKKDLAAALNKRPSEISKWLSGTHNFNIDTLFDIEEVLRIELINVSEKPKEQVIYYQISISQKQSFDQKVAFEELSDDYLAENSMFQMVLNQSTNYNC